jgi:hypothetical protein
MVNQATISRTFGSSHAPKLTSLPPKIKKRFLTPFLRPNSCSSPETCSKQTTEAG